MTVRRTSSRAALAAARSLPFVVAALTFAPGPARAEILWRGDFETGDKSQWDSIQEVSEERLQVVDAPVRQGQHALRVEVEQGDNPIHASGNRNELAYLTPEKEGDERYFAWSTMWPADYPYSETWQLFTQWHHSGNTGSPPMEFYVWGDEIRLRVGGTDDGIIWTQPLVRGVWHDFLLHVRWSSDPDVGFVELWLDGQLVLPLEHVATMFPGQDNLLKQGLYRDDAIAEDAVLYHDGMTEATTLEDLQPPPAPPAPTADASPPVVTASVDPTAGGGGCGVVSSRGDAFTGAALLLGLLGLTARLRRRAVRYAHRR